MLDLAVGFGLFLLGVVFGWQLRDLKAESDEYRAEEERDAQWDARHPGGGDDHTEGDERR